MTTTICLLFASCVLMSALMGSVIGYCAKLFKEYVFAFVHVTVLILGLFTCFIIFCYRIYNGEGEINRKYYESLNGAQQTIMLDTSSFWSRNSTRQYANKSVKIVDCYGNEAVEQNIEFMQFMMTNMQYICVR